MIKGDLIEEIIAYYHIGEIREERKLATLSSFNNVNDAQLWLIDSIAVASLSAHLRKQQENHHAIAPEHALAQIKHLPSKIKLHKSIRPFTQRADLILPLQKGFVLVFVEDGFQLAGPAVPGGEQGGIAGNFSGLFEDGLPLLPESAVGFADGLELFRGQAEGGLHGLVELFQPIVCIGQA